ncbi:hypothetical protein BGP77_06670 [Saccharospirillum sp. MSK14-1]|uniref:hypothetical protein n=1 Tax=Saccharospirillum sp. MSK14-1 TaxID=1897632 RepID=UPI000D3C9E2D|nr:hypothetical protein [Saccharospirillum sp. MSK14-1]PTY36963.1 hypothetical protein BGP77_06670 [Saccharospirillum sp. MSK14-1]
MKKFLLLLLVVAQATFGYEFYSGNKTYSSQRVSVQLSAEYGQPLQITTVIVAAQSQDHPLYIEQQRQLRSLDAETLQVIFVSSLVDRPQTSGYHTDPETAVSILNDAPFRLLIISPQGKEWENSQSVLTTNDIVNAMTN